MLLYHLHFHVYFWLNYLKVSAVSLSWFHIWILRTSIKKPFMLNIPSRMKQYWKFWRWFNINLKIFSLSCVAVAVWLVLVVSCVHSCFEGRQIQFKSRHLKIVGPPSCSVLSQQIRSSVQNRLIGSSFKKRARMLERVKTPSAGKLLFKKVLKEIQGFDRRQQRNPGAVNNVKLSFCTNQRSNYSIWWLFAMVEIIIIIC